MAYSFMELFILNFIDSKVLLWHLKLIMWTKLFSAIWTLRLWVYLHHIDSFRISGVSFTVLHELKMIKTVHNPWEMALVQGVTVALPNIEGPGFRHCSLINRIAYPAIRVEMSKSLIDSSVLSSLVAFHCIYMT